MRQTLSSCFTWSTLRRKLPILKWLPSYSKDYIVKDFIAGTTVGLTTIPQAIAYAIVAGLSPQYGLYSAFVGPFVYIFLGSCKDITVGPTAITALLTAKYIKLYGPDFYVLLTFLTGCIVMLLGVLHLGFLVDFMSLPVTVGFTSAAALTIASSQIKPLFGLAGSSSSFMSSVQNLFDNYNTFSASDSALGLSTIVILMIIKHFQPRAPCREDVPTRQKMLHNFMWLFGLAKYAVVVLLGMALGYACFLNGSQPFRLAGAVGSGLPDFEAPPFSMEVRNQTLTFLDMTSQMQSGLITIPICVILEHIAIAKAFAKGKSIDASQELIAVGCINILGAFFAALPSTGSFTKSVVNNASGVVTPLCGLFTGGMVLLSLSFLTSTFFFIPRATLAGVIFFAMYHMIEYGIICTLWNTKKFDLIPLFASLISCLLMGLEYGMPIGVAVNIVYILYNTARPEVTLKWLTVQDQNILLVTPTQSLYFPAANYLSQLIIDTCQQKAGGTTAPVIIDGIFIHIIDSTAVKGLNLLTEELQIRKQPIYFWRWNETAMLNCLGFNAKLRQYFKFEDSIEQLLKHTDIPPQSDSNQEILKSHHGCLSNYGSF